MEKLLKEWRQDAMHKHQYESAIYIGDKLLALTGICSNVPPASTVLIYPFRRRERRLLPSSSTLLHRQLYSGPKLSDKA